MKRKIFWTAFTVIILLIAIAIVLTPTIVGLLFSSKKTSFTDSQTAIIAEKLDLDSSKIKVDKMVYGHSQDKSFVFDISLKDIDSVERNYDYSRKEIYGSKNKSYLYCEIGKKDSEYSGKFYIIDHYDKELDEMVDE